MFQEDFLNNLPDDTYEAASLICNHFFSFDSQFKIPGKKIKAYKDYVEAYMATEIFLEIKKFKLTSISFTQDKLKNLDNIINFFKVLRIEIKKREDFIFIEKSREKFRQFFGQLFIYEFSNGDLILIQKLINELRDLITHSELFDSKYKERLLKKLEGLQSEIHKKMSNLDKFWGFVGELGVVLGKFGKDAKPFVDRIREILQIVWRTQARSEELPSATAIPLLTSGQKPDGQAHDQE
jgi:hypothetical protein